MATLRHNQTEYDVENSEVYYKADTDEDERELVARISIDPDDLTDDLLQALYGDHGEVREFSLFTGGIEYHMDATKTTVANQEITDPVQGETEAVLEVGIMTPRDQVFIQLED